jgi:hypothetical protein
MKIAETLSVLDLAILFLITESTIFPLNECILSKIFPFFLKLQIIFRISLLSILSKIPSPKLLKQKINKIILTSY